MKAFINQFCISLSHRSLTRSKCSKFCNPFSSALHFHSYTGINYKANKSRDDTNDINNTTDTDPLQYMRKISSLIKQLFSNPKNFKALTNLDTMLSQTHYLNCSSTSLFVVEGLSRIKKLQRAKDVVLVMKRNNKVCDFFLYSLVFDCLVKDGKIDEVDRLWGEICENVNVDRRKIDFSDYVVYVCKFGDVCEVRRVGEKVVRDGKALREQSYTALIGALSKNNEGLLAKSVLEEMNDKGYKANDFSYVSMFQCFCRNGELDEADWILRRLARRKFKMDVFIYGSFLHGLCKSGKFREADKLFRKLIDRDHMKDGSDVELLKLGRRAILQLDCRGGLVPEIVAYETYFRSLCSIGRLEEAEILLKKMMKKSWMPETCVYASFIKALCRAGRNEDAKKFLDIERKKGLVSVDEIERVTVLGLCESGKLDDAVRIFNEMAARDVLVAGRSVCNSILNSYWKAGRVAEAESLFEMIIDGSFGQPDVQAYSIMIRGFCDKRNISKALGIFEEMLERNIPVDGTFYEIIIRGLWNCQCNKEANKLLNEMIENKRLVSYGKWKTLVSPVINGDQFS